MKSPAYLVEGDLEQLFIQQNCPGLPVRKINCNGDKVLLAQIAKRVGTLARLLHKKHDPIIVVMDREKREQSSIEMEKDLLEHLKSEDIDSKIIIGVPDREIENWILADYESFCKSCGCVDASKKKDFEGKSGKSQIKQLLSNNITYIETIHGVKWLKASRPHVMIKNSESFRRFAKAIEHMSCWWLRQNTLVLEESGQCC